MAKSKKKGDSYVWMDDEVELLLPVSLDYKANKCQNINKQTSSHHFGLTAMGNIYKQQLPVHVRVMMSPFPKTSVFSDLKLSFCVDRGPKPREKTVFKTSPHMCG